MVQYNNLFLLINVTPFNLDDWGKWWKIILTDELTLSGYRENVDQLTPG